MKRVQNYLDHIFILLQPRFPQAPSHRYYLAHPKSRLSVAHLVFGIVVAVIVRPTVWIFCVSSFSVAHLVFGIGVAVIFRSTVRVFVSPFHETLRKEFCGKEMSTADPQEWV